jgi:nucleotide-binding universal stress UspA family protein
LAWAVDQAAKQAAELVVVHAWDYLTVTHAPSFASEKRASEVLTNSLAGVDTRGVAIRTRLVEGRPVTALIRESLDADMLVVGSRGRSGVAAVILGSVSTACVHHASCPVVVVPPPRAVPAEPHLAEAQT